MWEGAQGRSSALAAAQRGCDASAHAAAAAGARATAPQNIAAHSSISPHPHLLSSQANAATNTIPMPRIPLATVRPGPLAADDIAAARCSRRWWSVFLASIATCLRQRVPVSMRHHGASFMRCADRGERSDADVRRRAAAAFSVDCRVGAVRDLYTSMVCCRTLSGAQKLSYNVACSPSGNCYLREGPATCTHGGFACARARAPRRADGRPHPPAQKRNKKEDETSCVLRSLVAGCIAVQIGFSKREGSSCKAKR